MFTDMFEIGKVFIVAAVVIGLAATLAAPFVALADNRSFTLEVDADPNNGPAPLLDVDLTAETASTGLSGPTTYKFDCENDGTWEKIVETHDNVVTASNLCDYPDQGVFEALIFASRDGLSADGTATIIVEEPKTPALSIDKTANTQTANPGDTVGYTIVVESTGDADAENVRVTDTLESGLTFSGTNKESKQFFLGTLEAGTSKTLTTDVDVATDVATPQDLTNTATAEADKVDPVSDSATIHVQEEGQPALSINKTVDTGTANPGDTVGYTIVVESTGNVDAENVRVTDELPNGLTFSGTDKTSKEFFIGTLSPGSSKTLTADVDVAQDIATPQDLTNTATAEADDVNPVSDTATLRVEGEVAGDDAEPVLEVVKTANKNFTTPGTTVTFTISITNSGDAPAVNVVASDALPNDFTTAQGNSSIEFTFDKIEEDETVTESFVANVAPDAEIGDHTNVVTVRADNHEDVTDDFTVEVREGEVLGETGVSPTTMALMWIGIISAIGGGGYYLWRRHEARMLWARK